MQAFKAKTTSEQPEEENSLLGFRGAPSYGCARIQAIYYSSKNPSRHLLLYDGDGDMFLFPVPGQETEKVIPLDCEITVKLPLQYIDQDGPGNDIIVFGEMVAM